jgi:hypothetical protein
VGESAPAQNGRGGGRPSGSGTTPSPRLTNLRAPAPRQPHAPVSPPIATRSAGCCSQASSLQAVQHACCRAHCRPSYRMPRQQAMVRGALLVPQQVWKERPAP